MFGLAHISEWSIVSLNRNSSLYRSLIRNVFEIVPSAFQKIGPVTPEYWYGLSRA